MSHFFGLKSHLKKVEKIKFTNAHQTKQMVSLMQFQITNEKHRVNDNDVLFIKDKKMTKIYLK